MRQTRISRQHRSVLARRRTTQDQFLALDPRDPDVVRVKRLLARQAQVSGRQADHRDPLRRPVAPSTGRRAARDDDAS